MAYTMNYADLKYYTVKVIYSSISSDPVLEPRCGIASSSLPLTPSLASWSDSTEELMGQGILSATKNQDTVLQLNSHLLM